MKKIVALLLFLPSVLFVFGQQKAVTDSGEEVILYDDGSWKYQNEEEQATKEIKLNEELFLKDESSTFLLKSSKVNVGFWINPKKWSFKKAEDNLDAEYELNLKSEDLYAMVISEKVEIPLETLKNLAFENGKEEAPDLKIVKEEYRNVNGIKVLFLHMNGTMQGIKFSYYGYYYSNNDGSVQFITYTSQNLMNVFINECDNLLNGIVELD